MPSTLARLFSFSLVLFLVACVPALKKPSEVVLGKGVIKVLDEKRMLIQETTSVVALDLDHTSGRYLSDRYDAGQKITLVGTKTIDKNGDSKETITAIIFEDGSRFNIVS